MNWATQWILNEIWIGENIFYLPRLFRPAILHSLIEIFGNSDPILLNLFGATGNVQKEIQLMKQLL